MEIVNISTLFKSLNPVSGCTAGCSYCFAKKINDRFKITPDFEVPTFFEDRLTQIKNGKPQKYFMTSMSDFSEWQEVWRSKVIKQISQFTQHDYLFLTKFPEKLNFETSLNNLWVGATITGKGDVRRIEALRKNVIAKKYFLTFEPLFSDLGELDLSKINWIVIGTETGNRKGKIIAQKDWILNIAKQAKAKNVPVFMKESLLPIVGEVNMLQQLPFEQF